MANSRVLATFGSGPMRPILRLVLPTFKDYAERHGYDVVVGTGQEAAPRPHSWSKIPLFLDLFERYEEVLWLDSDVVIRRGDADVAAEVPSGYWQALVEIKDAPEVGAHPNLGVWYLRRSDEAKEFLRILWESQDFIDHPYWENAAALRALGYTVEQPIRRVAESEWLRGTYLLPAEFNSMIRCPVEHPRFIHYTAIPNRERAALIRSERGLPASRLEDRLIELLESDGYRRWRRRVKRLPLVG